VRRVIVTGGAGFIGSHECRHLLNGGCEVLCVDNFCTGSRSNIAPLLAHPRFEMIRHDVCFPLYLQADAIYNFACPASPVHYRRDPVQTIKTNVQGAIHLLGLAKRLHIPILQASTSEVYGDAQVHPQPESYRGNVNPIGPRACYDEGKRCAETLFFDYRRRHGVRIKVARIFNTYGPNMQPDDGRVVSNFIGQALRHRPLTLYGQGTQTRSFCYVSDLIEGLHRLMNTPDEVTGPINLGSPAEVGIGALAQRIIELTGSRSILEYRELPADDPQHRRPDTREAERLLSWRARMSLDDGLRRTIDYFRTQLDA
jgi:UDP-glucuronate decarboxylase